MSETNVDIKFSIQRTDSSRRNFAAIVLFFWIFDWWRVAFAADADSDKIIFRWYKADGCEEDKTTIDVSENKFVRGFDVPQNGVKVKFTEVINEKGDWLEVGEVTRDNGKSWFKFFEMELIKVWE